MATVLISATFFNLQLESSKEAKRVEAIFATSIRNKEAQPRLKVLGVKNVEVKTAPEKQVRVPILMYHHVSDTFREGDPWAPRLTVSTTNFRAQMNYLKDAGYVTVGFDDLYRSLYINKPLPPKSVIITFDDGFADNYEYAYPILKQNKQTATFFVMSNFFNQDDYMTANQVKEMSDDGMSIESHTVNHAKLSALSGAELRHELSDSKKLIEKIINKPIYFLAYPYGSHTEETKEASQRAGYFLAVTTLSGSTQSSHDPFGLYRIAIPAHSQLDVDWFAKAIN